jgi:hypothetical protein
VAVVVWQVEDGRVVQLLSLSLGEAIRAAFRELDCAGGVPPRAMTVPQRLRLLEQHLGLA